MSRHCQSVHFYLKLNCPFSVGLSLDLMKLGKNDRMAKGYKVTERMLNICVNGAN